MFFSTMIIENAIVPYVDLYTVGNNETFPSLPKGINEYTEINGGVKTVYTFEVDKMLYMKDFIDMEDNEIYHHTRYSLKSFNKVATEEPAIKAELEQHQSDIDYLTIMVEG